jgi:hypothetical protein
MIAQRARPQAAPRRSATTPTDAPAILPRPLGRPAARPSDRPTLTVHRAHRTETRDATRAALAADRSLHRASELLSPPLATQVLRDRMRDARGERLIVQEVTLLEHVTGEHCVLRFSVLTRGVVRVWHGVIHADDRSLRHWLTQRRLWSAGLRCVPQPLGVVPERRLYLARPVDGAPLLAAMLTTPSAPRLADAVLRACRATAELPLLPERSWSVNDATERCIGGGAQPLLPSACAERLRALIEPLERRCTLGVIHPDARPEGLILHAGRVIVQAPGPSALGDPAQAPGAIIGALLLHGAWYPRERTAAHALASALLARAARQWADPWHPDAVSRWACIGMADAMAAAHGSPSARWRGADRSADLLLERLLQAIERDGTIAAVLG